MQEKYPMVSVCFVYIWVQSNDGKVSFMQERIKELDAELQCLMEASKDYEKRYKLAEQDVMLSAPCALGLTIVAVGVRQGEGESSCRARERSQGLSVGAETPAGRAGRGEDDVPRGDSACVMCDDMTRGRRNGNMLRAATRVCYRRSKMLR